MFARSGKIFLLILAVSLVAASAGIVLRPRDHTARMKLLVKNSRAQPAISPEPSAGGGYRESVSASQVSSEIELMKSRDVLQRVVRQAGLAMRALDDGAPERAESLAIRKLEQDLTVQQIKQTNLVEASYAAATPEDAEAVLTHLADAYLEHHVMAHHSAGSYEFFREQADLYEQLLRQAEEELSRFQSRNPELVLLGERKTLEARRLSDVEAALSEARAGHQEAARKVETIQGQLVSTESRITTQHRRIPNQYAIERLKTLIVQLQNRRTELLTRMQPDDRLVREVEQQIADTESALSAALVDASDEVSTDLNPVRQQIEQEHSTLVAAKSGLEARQAVLAQEAATLRSKLVRLEDATATFDSMRRRVQELEKNALLFATKREEARIAEELDRQKIMNVVFVEKPNVLSQAYRQAIAIEGAFAVLVSLLLAGGAVLLREVARSTAHTPAELETATGIPVLATIPMERSRPPRRAWISDLSPQKRSSGGRSGGPLDSSAEAAR